MEEGYGRRKGEEGKSRRRERRESEGGKAELIVSNLHFHPFDDRCV